MSGFETDCQSVKSMLDAGDEFLLLDCREEDEWNYVHIDGATLLPLSEIQDRIGELESHRSSDIVVYCHHGGRSLQVTLWLKQQGFRSVRNMSGGVDAWAQLIDPVLPRY